MKVFPSDRGDGDKVLPEAETCFFIIKLPRFVYFQNFLSLPSSDRVRQLETKKFRQVARIRNSPPCALGN